MRRTLFAKISRILLIGAIALVLSWPTIATFLVQDALRTARLQGAQIAWQGVTASYSSVKITTVEVWIPGPPLRVTVGGRQLSVPGPSLKLELHDLIASVDPLSLTRLSPVVELSTTSYGGSCKAVVSNLLDNHVSIDLNVSDVRIDRHPQLAALGLSGGTINLTGRDLVFALNTRTVLRGTFDAAIEGLSLPPRPELKTFLKVDGVQIQSLKLSGEFADHSISFAPLLLQSTLGSVEGTGSFSPPRHGAPLTFQVRSTVKLAPGEAAQLGQWLPLISSGALTAQDTTFTVRSRSVPCSSQGRIVRYDGGCLTVEYSALPPAG